MKMPGLFRARLSQTDGTVNDLCDLWISYIRNSKGKQQGSMPWKIQIEIRQMDN
jgi:hypothetical protein